VGLAQRSIEQWGLLLSEKGVKLSNQIQVAPNVEIGEDTVYCRHTWESLVRLKLLGKNCMIGGQVGICRTFNNWNNVRIQAQAGVGQKH
jgi:UDP-3-O-[3-hydroxymyristoyl] glucosamine N-acyltransferase